MTNNESVPILGPPPNKKKRNHLKLPTTATETTTTTTVVTPLGPPPPPPPPPEPKVKSKIAITQEKIIERIRNASTNLEFREKRWQAISEQAKDLLRGLLNVDPKKRMKLKDLSRHEWIRSGGVCLLPPNAANTCRKKPATQQEVFIDLSEPSPVPQLNGNVNPSSNSNHLKHG